MTKPFKSISELIIRIRNSDSAYVRRSTRDGEIIDIVVLTLERKKENIACQSAIIPNLCQQGLLIRNADGLLTLTAEANSWHSRQKTKFCREDAFRAQHNQIKSIKVPMAKQPNGAIMIVDPESPLAWLARRKDKNGEQFLSVALVQAGERLRMDFTRGCMMQSTTMNWNAGRASISSSAHGNGTEHIGDNALDARARIAKAIEAVGPELFYSLMDVCCYLKSITDVEKSRQWPARSGKLILKLGLQALARHYGLLYDVPMPMAGTTTRQKGATDYRPTL